MRILFATEYFWPWTPGGSATSIRELAEALAARGHRVSVVTPRYGPAPSIEWRDGVRVVRFAWRRRLDRGPHHAPSRDFLSPDWHLAFAVAIAREAKHLGADVLHAQEKHALVATALAARWRRRPVFGTVRDTGVICPIATCLLDHDFVPEACGAAMLQRACIPFFVDHYHHPGRWQTRVGLALRYADARLKARVWRRLDGVIGLSAAHLHIVQQALGLTRTHVVPNVFAPPRVSHPVAPVSPPQVLLVGRVTLGKGIPVFVEAAADIRARFGPVEFIAAGPVEARMRRLAGPIRCVGAVTPLHLDTLYRHAAIVAQPSLAPEASSRVALEAAAHARPLVVSTAGGGAESVEHRVTGLVVPRGNARALAEALLELLHDPTYAALLGRQARTRALDRFGAERIVPRLLAVYGEAA